jgi:ATP-dependent Zn protease
MNALLRPGRFDRRVLLDLPDRADREEILTIHARTKPFAEDVNLKVIAERTPEEKSGVEEAIKQAKDALNSENIDQMNQATEKLTSASHSLAQKMYEQASKAKAGASGAQQHTEGAQPKEQGGNENVVDADYEVMDEDSEKKKKK